MALGAPSPAPGSPAWRPWTGKRHPGCRGPRAPTPEGPARRAGRGRSCPTRCPAGSPSRPRLPETPDPAPTSWAEHLAHFRLAGWGSLRP